MKEEMQKKHQQEKQLKKAKENAHIKPATSIDSQQKKKFWLGVATASIIAFGAWILFPSSPDADYVTNEEKQKILNEFEAVDSYKIERITNIKEIKQAILSMKLNKAQQEELEKKVDDGDMDMAWIQAWDNRAEDGDVLRFDSHSYTITTTIMNKPVIFALPLAKGINYVKVTGIHDGGGGITASVITSSGAKSVPVIDEGMSYTLPVK